MDVKFEANSKTEIMSFTITMTKEDVLESIRANAIITQPGWEIKEAKCQIPTGGDYSGMSIDTTEVPIFVTLVRKTNE